MAIQHAIHFIQDSQKNPELRKTVNRASYVTQIYAELKEEGYDFTPEEFEESVNLLHVKCQSEDQANHLMDTVMWFRMVVSSCKAG